MRGERKEGESADLTLGELLIPSPGGFEEDVRVIHPAVIVLDRDKKGAFADEDLHEFAQEMGVYTNAWMRGLERHDRRQVLHGLHDAVLRPPTRSWATATGLDTPPRTQTLRPTGRPRASRRGSRA